VPRSGSSAPRLASESRRDEPRHGAPLPLAIGRHGAGGSDRRVVQPGAGDELLDQPRLPFSRLSLDKHDLSARGLGTLPRRGGGRELSRATEQRRARPRRRRRREDAAPYPRLADALDEARQLGARRRVQRVTQRAREVLGDAQGRRAVTREREGAHRRAGRWLGRGIEGYGAERGARRRRRVAAGELCLGGLDQRLEPLRAPQGALRAEPGLELVRVRERESLEEFPFHERRR